MKNKKFGKKQVFVINAQPFRQECVVIVNGQVSDAVKFLKKLNSPNAKENIKHIEDEQAKGGYQDIHNIGRGEAQTYTELPHGYIMCISHTSNWMETTGLVVHETLHLTHYILRRAGVILSQESEEIFTYLQGKMVEDILSKIY